ncbi:MAG: phenylalanine--tRNA ligase subunit alpha, partial [Longimicrobiales bacterium]
MTGNLDTELAALEAEGRATIAAAQSAEELEAARIRLLGRKEGRLTAIMRGLGALAPADRPAAGARANEVKAVLTELLDAQQADLERAAAADTHRVDLTLPGRAVWHGARHPVALIISEICDVFGSLGFTRARGPEAETDWYNFTALNTPLDHPAADMHDTFYLAPGVLLRSHTSPVQV